MAQQVPSAPTIIRRRQVESRIGLSRTSIYRKLNPGHPEEYDPTFPKPVSIGARAVGWVESEISQWLSQRIEASRKAA